MPFSPFSSSARSLKLRGTWAAMILVCVRRRGRVRDDRCYGRVDSAVRDGKRCVYVGSGFKVTLAASQSNPQLQSSAGGVAPDPCH